MSLENLNPPPPPLQAWFQNGEKMIVIIVTTLNYIFDVTRNKRKLM